MRVLTRKSVNPTRKLLTFVLDFAAKKQTTLQCIVQYRRLQALWINPPHHVKKYDDDEDDDDDDDDEDDDDDDNDG